MNLYGEFSSFFASAHVDEIRREPTLWKG